MIEKKYRKVKVSVIQCPCPNCGGDVIDKLAENNVEATTQLIDDFANHLIDKHGILLSQKKIYDIQNKINYIRTNSKVHYIDPFFTISWDEIRPKKLSEL